MNNENTKKERYVNTVFILVLGILIGAMITIPISTYIANKKSARLVSELEQKVAELEKEKGPGDTVQQDTGPGDTGPQDEELDNTPQKIVEDTNKDNANASSEGQQGGGGFIPLSLSKTKTKPTTSATPAPNQIKVLEDTNLYSRPDEKSKVLGKVKKGENLIFLKEAGFGWLKCKNSKGEVVFVYYYHTDYQNPGKEEVLPKTPAKLIKTTWLREKPGLSGKRKRKVKKNTKLVMLAVVDLVEDEESSWYLALIDDGTNDIGYLYGDDIDLDVVVYSDTEGRLQEAEILVLENSFQATENPAQATENSTVALATVTASPQENNNPTSAPATVTVSPQTTENPTSAPATVTASPQTTENPTSEPEMVTASPQATINLSSELAVASPFNIWFNPIPVIATGTGATVTGTEVTEETETETAVTGAAVTGAAVTGSAVTGSAVTGTAIDVKEEEDTETFEVTIMNSTNCYKEDDTNSEVIANLQAGDKVTDVTEAGKGWLKGNVNGSEVYFYYLHTDYCKVANKEEILKEKYSNKVAVVIADGVNVRTAPSITAKVVNCVGAGTTFKAKSLIQIMDGEKHGWTKITVNGIDLYVYSEYVKIKDKEDDSKSKDNATETQQRKRESSKNETGNKETEKQEVEEKRSKSSKRSGTKKATTDKEALIERRFNRKYKYTGTYFRKKGEIYENGWRYTWYSSNTLYHYKTPQWTLDKDKIYRDKNGYVCVACSSLKKGTIVPTIFGEGIVQDDGCGKDTIDIYTAF